MNGAAKFGGCQLGANRCSRFGDQLGGVFADRLCANQLTSRSVRNPFYEALGVADGQGFAQCPETEFPGLDRDTHLLRFLLAHPDRSHFGGRENTDGNVLLVTAPVPPTNVLGSYQALRGGRMRQLEAAGDVTHCETVGTWVRPYSSTSMKPCGLVFNPMFSS